MVATGSLREVFLRNREEYEQETALLAKSDIESLKDFYEEYKEIVCPLEDSTFEEFLGYMIVCGLNNTRDELARLLGHKLMQANGAFGLFKK